MSNILTPREREIFKLLIDNYNTKEIASKLGISEQKTQVQSLGCKQQPTPVVLPG